MKYLIALLLTLSLASCGDSNSSTEGDGVSIVTNPDELNARLTNESTPLELVDLAGTLIFKKTKDFTLTLVSSVAPPVVDGFTTQATDIAFKDHVAFISYNYAGETQKGAVDAINIKEETEPAITSQVNFSNADINAIAVSGSKVYLAGASTLFSPAAFAGAMTIEENKFLGALTTVTLESYAATDVIVGGDSVYVTTGNTGGVFALDKSSLAITSSDATLADGRSVAMKGDEISVLGGTNGRVQSYDKNLSKQGNTFEIGGATIPESKSTIDLGTDTALVALNDGGVKIICRKDLITLGTIPAVTINGVASEKTVSNAAYMESGLLFVANGEAGVYVYHVVQSNKSASLCKDRTITFQGAIAFGSSLSANHVYFKSNYLFVADGLGGLKVVEVENTKGEDDDDDHDED